MREEDFLPDFRPDTFWGGCLMGALWTFIPIAGVLDGKTLTEVSYAASVLILVATLTWLAFQWQKRGKGFVIGEGSIERVEHDITVWTLGWKNVVALPKGSKVEIHDLTGHSWGRIPFDLSAKSSMGRKGRILFARLLSHAARVEWRHPSLAERRRRYAFLGSTLLGGGLALSIPACLRTARMVAEVEQGIWNRGLNTAAVFALIGGLLALMLGVVELTHLRTDRSEEPSEPSIAEFLARPVPVPVEMMPGRLYRYRDAGRVRANWRQQLRILMLFLGGVLLVMPIAFALGSRLREEPLRWIDLVGMEALLVGVAGLLWPLFRAYEKPLTHRFRRAGDFLEVDTGKEIKRYPWDTAKEKMAKTRGTTWMSGYTTFGKGFRTYNLDRCWIEQEPAEEGGQWSERGRG